MAIARRGSLEGFQRAFVASWAGFGVVLLAVGARSFLLAPALFTASEALTAVVPSLFFFAVALAYWRAWPGYRALVSIAGSAITLYGLALFTLGMEDAGGPKVVVPGFILCAALGVWSLLLAVAEPNRRAQSAG